MLATRSSTYDPSARAADLGGKRSPRWNCVHAALAALLAVLAVAVAAPPSAPAQGLENWECDAFAYLFQSPDPTTHYITRVDLATGQSEVDFLELDSSVNAVGFNVVDGFFYGMGLDDGATTRYLAKVHPDGFIENLGLPEDSLGVPMNDQPGYPTGDVDLNGHYWAMNTTVEEWYEVDLNQDPPTVLRRGTPIRVGADTPTNPADDLGLPSDWVFIGNELYGVVPLPGQPTSVNRLLRFNQSTGAFENLGPSLGPDPMVGAAGAVFSDGRYLYASVNSTGQLFRIDPQTRATVELPTGPQSGENDGARCQLAPIPTITVTKTVNGRVRAADQFTVSLATAGGAPVASATTTGGNTTASTTNFPASQGQTYTISDAMAPGSPTPLGEYVKSIACTDADGNPVAVGGTGPSWTLAVEATNYTCNVTNQAVADIVLEKSAAPTPVVPGEDVTFTMKVTNNGPSTAIGQTISDDLPDQVTFASASQGCSEASGTVTCAVGELAPGASQEFTITARVASSLDECLRNTATVTGPTFDPNTSNNTATICTPIEGRSNIALSKDASSATVAAGGQVMYTLVVRNNGPSDDPGVTVTDPLPAGLALVSAQPSQGTCTTTNNVVSCDLGALRDRGSAQVLVTANATGTAAGTCGTGSITNTARVQGAHEDPNADNNQASAQICVEPPPDPRFDLAVNKTGGTNVRVGQRTTYRIVVRNNGPDAAPNAKATDTFNGRATVVSVNTPQGSCTESMPIKCELGTIAAGDSVRITVVIKPRETGRLRNAASATGDGTDTTPDNNMDTVDTRVRKVPLRLSKVASRSSVSAGDTLSYRIRVRNPSKGEARNVRVCDRPGSGMSYVSSKPTARRSGGQRCWTIKRLGPGKSRTFQVTVRVARGANGRLTNRATVQGRDARAARAVAGIRVRGVSTPVTG